MDNKLYDLMNWPRIEAIVYSEEDKPHDILGAHITEDGILFQTFQPDVKSVSLVLTETEQTYDMELVDEQGVYAVLIKGKKIPNYRYLIDKGEDTIISVIDPYQFGPQITVEDTKKFDAGMHYEIYEYLGAHFRTINGVSGVCFAVWAPNAVRVSVVGDFNNWDGRVYQMRRLWDSGIFEIFIPDRKVGEFYKYEIKVKGGLIILKADPYANRAQLRPETASVLTDIDSFEWKDDEWIKNRENADYKKEPLFIYELHLGSFLKPENEEEQFLNYRELAKNIAKYVKQMGYTHIELMPVMEHPFDGSWGYQVTGYYAPTARYGTPEDFMYFIDYMHKQNIGVIIDWVPAHFPRDTFGLSNFDGTCLYEHQDPRQGWHPHWGTLIYNFGRPQVSNFLIANALFWAEKYHVDGIRMDAVASMLYLDYGKNHGEWIANIYGGNENLEAVEMLKHLNSVMKKRNKGVLVIAEESTAWPLITEEVDNGGLGFDLKWNMGWMNDFLGYMRYDPYFRTHHYGELTFSMVYAYSEHYLLNFSHDEVVHGKASMVGKMPGTMEDKLANLRLAYGYMVAHPGKKLLFMGQDFAQYNEWSEDKSIEWELLQYDQHRKMQAYTKALLKLYKDKKALYELDYDPEGFEWINHISANENIIVFVRKTEDKNDTLLILCNFAPQSYEKYKIGVPYEGQYKEIFNSDSVKFGGNGFTNTRIKVSQKDECDGREDSLYIKVPPLGITIFEYQADESGLQEQPVKKVKKATEPIVDVIEKKESQNPKDAVGKKGAKSSKVGTGKEINKSSKAGTGKETSKSAKALVDHIKNEAVVKNKEKQNSTEEKATETVTENAVTETAAETATEKTTETAVKQPTKEKKTTKSDNDGGKSLKEELASKITFHDEAENQ